MTGQKGGEQPKRDELSVERRRADWPSGRVVEDEVRRAALAARLQAYLQDEDIERVGFFHTRFFSISVATLTGVPLDPYSLFDIHRAADAVAGLIPLSGWERPALRVRVVLHSSVGGRKPTMSLEVRHVDPRAGRRDLKGSSIPAHPAIAAELRRRIEPVLPKGRQSEPRVLDCVVWRRLRGG